MKASHLSFDPGLEILILVTLMSIRFSVFCPCCYAATPNPCGDVIDASFDIIFGPDLWVKVSRFDETSTYR